MKKNLNRIYEFFEKPMVKILSEIEINGIKIDKEYLKNYLKNFTTNIKKLKKKFFLWQKKNLI